MKHIRELIILAVVCLAVYLYFAKHDSDTKLVEAQKKHDQLELQKKHEVDSLVELKNEYARNYFQTKSEFNSMAVENKFLKNLLNQKDARYEREKRNRAPHLADSAITRAWAAYYKY